MLLINKSRGFILLSTNLLGMADSGPGVSGPGSTGPSSMASDSDGRLGMIQVNNLVYKLEPDLSVTINRTHKIQYPQSQDYTSDQTTIFIINSGADYIDCARSWLSFDLEVPEAAIPAPTSSVPAVAASLATLPVTEAMLNHYFGACGSVLNLIDSVVVSSRSGDELSRVNDYGQLMNIYIPLVFGQDWRDTIGSNMAMGSYVGAPNSATIDGKVEQRRSRFSVPLYLLSPFFNYGRLMPSMIMSGLRVEIRWKPLDVACQQFWQNAPKYLHSFGANASQPLYNDDSTEFATFLCPNGLVGTNPSFPVIGVPKLADGAWPVSVDSRWTWNGPDLINLDSYGSGFGELVCQNPAGVNNNFVPLGNLLYTADMVGAGHPLVGQRIFAVGSTILLPFDELVQDGVPPDDVKDGDLVVWHNNHRRHFNGQMSGLRFTVMDTAAGGTLIARCDSAVSSFIAKVCDGVFGTGGERTGAMLLAQRGPMVYETVPGALIFSGLLRLPSSANTKYVIKKPHLHLCSNQLTDAIQRVLNEYSSVNGLEIVFADFDRTSSPFTTVGDSNPVYMEIRKSASRALMAFARVVDTSPNAHLVDSFASSSCSFWEHYQYQLGSLYFPQQRVEDNTSNTEIRRDNVASLAYNFCLDAFDRLHPKAAPTMLSLRGPEDRVNLPNYHPVGSTGEHGGNEYLKPVSSFGKWGSFVNGACTVATTLERSSAFDLSGIPTNNARVLALRGSVGFKLPAGKVDFRATLVAYMKYVRLARVFLLNVEVEQ